MKTENLGTIIADGVMNAAAEIVVNAGLRPCDVDTEKLLGHIKIECHKIVSIVVGGKILDESAFKAEILEAAKRACAGIGVA
jgi:hypothetical protein